jgi:hypothetical protein
METAQRVLAQDAYNVEAMRVATLYMLAREARPAASLSKLQVWPGLAIYGIAFGRPRLAGTRYLFMVSPLAAGAD